MEPKTKTILLILVSFALGAVAGVVTQKYHLDSRGQRRPDFAEVRKQFAQRIRLDSVQMAQVDSLMDHHRKKMDDIRKLFSAERDTLRAEIRKFLTPDQNTRFEDFIKEADSHRRDADKMPVK